MKAAVLFLLLFISLNGYTQTENKIIIGTKDTVFSATLDEHRTVWVHVPEGAREGKRYPVVYLLDGDVHFYAVAGMLQYLSNVAHLCPEVILVGIEHKDRMHDLTPTHDATVPKDSNLVRTSGGGEQFTSFIEKELIPYVDRKYPTAPYRVLIGHSLGGLLAINTLVNHTALFNAYIGIDPALFWDNQSVVRQARQALLNKRFGNKALFIGWSGDVPENKDAILKDTTLTTIVERSSLQFDMLVKTHPENGLIYTGRYYTREEHNTVPVPAIYDALRFVFRFTVPPDTERIALTPEYYINHYKMVSQRMGYTMLPPEDLINSTGYYFLFKKMFDRARGFFQMNIDNYPESYNVYDSMSDLYAAENNRPKAIDYLKKELQLKDLPYIRQKLADLEAGK